MRWDTELHHSRMQHASENDDLSHRNRAASFSGNSLFAFPSEPFQDDVRKSSKTHFDPSITSRSVGFSAFKREFLQDQSSGARS